LVVDVMEKILDFARLLGRFATAFVATTVVPWVDMMDNEVAIVRSSPVDLLGYRLPG
jgi:hypothetical protein